MPALQPTNRPHWDIIDGVIMFCLVSVLGALGVLAVGWYIAVSLGDWPTGFHGLWHWAGWSLAHVWDRPAIARGWVWYLRASGALTMILPVAPAILATIWVAKPGPAEIHVSGRRLSEDEDEAGDEMAEECKISGEGILIHPAIPISMDRETRHMFVLGSVGGGKTVMISSIIAQARCRGDRMMIHDSKGDSTAQLPGEITLFAPWDRRSHAWDIGSDVLDKGDARTVSARLIPDSSDPMWSNGSRQILAALICYCQSEYGTRWGFGELAALVGIEFEQLQQIVRKFMPEAIRTVEELNKTSQSFLVQLGAYMSPICDLAAAWDGRPRFSFRRWLLDQNSSEAKQKTLILQGNERYRELTTSYIQPIISVCGSLINSPELPDSSTRRIWLILDEFPQLGRLNNFSQFLEIGRSKGCRVVLGVQDIAQLRAIYDSDTVDAWSSMVGTYLVARAQGVETPDWLSRLIGQRTIRRYSTSMSSTADSIGQRGGGQRSESWETVDVPVIRPDEITSTLGPTLGGVRVLVLTGGTTVYRLVFPFPPKIQVRASYEPADWVLGGSPNPTDGDGIPVLSVPVRQHQEQTPQATETLLLADKPRRSGITGGSTTDYTPAQEEAGLNEKHSPAEEAGNEAAKVMATAIADTMDLDGVANAAAVIAILSQSVRTAKKAAEGQPAKAQRWKPTPAGTEQMKLAGQPTNTSPTFWDDY